MYKCLFSIIFYFIRTLICLSVVIKMYLMFKNYIFISIYISIFKNMESFALRIKQYHKLESGFTNFHYVKGSNTSYYQCSSSFFPCQCGILKSKREKI